MPQGSTQATSGVGACHRTLSLLRGAMSLSRGAFNLNRLRNTVLGHLPEASCRKFIIEMIGKVWMISVRIH